MYLIILLLNIVYSQEDDPMHTAIIYGSSDLGYYYVNLFVGTPPQQQSVIIDTGSSITAFPCDACTQCGKHIDEYFIREDSNSINELGCQTQISQYKCERCDKNRCIFSISYAEGSSLMGFFLQDEIMFGDTLMELYNTTQQQVTVKGVFGCTTYETNLFYTQAANGILGLSPKTNTSFAFPNVVDEIYKRRNDLNYFFSICIGRLDGYMTIGQYDRKRHQENSAYYTIPYHKTNGRDIYGVKVSQIKVNGTTIQAGADLQADYGTFIDSGSTLVNARASIVKAMVNYFKCNSTKCPEVIELEGLQCYRYNKTEHISIEQFMSYFPTYEFLMENNFVFQWTPENYLTKDIMEHSAYCLPVAEYYGSSRMILGQVWMRNWDIGFDKENQTITFVKSTCSSDPLFHNYTVDEQFRKETLQTNYVPTKKRHIPKDFEMELIYELMIIGGIALFIIITIIIVYYIIKRRKLKQNKKGTQLPEVDDEKLRK